MSSPALPESAFRGVLVLAVTTAPIELRALRTFTPVWVLLRGWGRHRIVLWRDAVDETGLPRTVLPHVAHVIVSGHGERSSAEAREWGRPGPTMRPEGLAELCPGLARLDLWVCEQGHQSAAWAAAWPARPPRVVAHRGTVLGPFPVAEPVARLWGRIRARLGW